MRKIKLDIQDIVDTTNIAELLTEQQRKEVALKAIEDFTQDKNQQSEWLENTERYLKVANCDVQERTVAWPGAHNACLPLIARACLASASRLYAELLRTKSPVQIAVLKSKAGQVQEALDSIQPQQAQEGQEEPRDITDEAVELIQKHLTYQLKMDPNCNWQEDLFTCCYLYYITGMVARYKYYDKERGAYRFRTLWPGEWCMSSSGYDLRFGRFSFFSELKISEIQEKVINGEYMAYEDLEEDPDWYECRSIVTQFVRMDLDGDGYPEPYCVVVDQEKSHLLELTKNYHIEIEESEDEDGIPFFSSNEVELDESGKIVKLKKVDPIPYVTLYRMYPSVSADGDGHSGTYCYGLAHYLYDINKTQNALTNQMLDIGTLQARQGAFIDQRARLPGGIRTVALNESIFVKPPPGLSLRDSITPFPRSEISPVQFQLLDYLTQLGNETANITEIMSGQVPDNTSPLIGMAAIQNSLLPFKTTYRLFLNGYSEEFTGIVMMNYIYVPDEEFIDLEKQELRITRELYSPNLITIQPTADPVISSDAERLGQQMILDTMMDRPEADDREILLNKCKVANIDDSLRFLPPPDPNPPPSPEIEQMKVNMQFVQDESERKWKELELKNTESMRKMEELKHTMAMDRMDALRDNNKEITEAKLRESSVLKNVAIAEAQEKGDQLDEYKAVTDRLEAENNDRTQRSGLNKLPNETKGGNNEVEGS